MAVDVDRCRPTARIHAIVLTRDRPETLRRCLATALLSLGTEDVITIRSYAL